MCTVLQTVIKPNVLASIYIYAINTNLVLVASINNKKKQGENKR